MSEVLFEQLTPTQVETAAWLASNSRLLLLSGDIRAGKTIGLILLAAEWTQQFPSAHHVALGRSFAALKRNVLPSLETSARALGLHYRKRDGGREVDVGNGTWHLIGVPNTAALEGVWGAEFQFGLIDDATRVPPEAVPVTITRFNRPQSKLALTFNPSTPKHKVKVDYVDRAQELGAVSTHANVRDNPSMTPEVLAGFERELHGHHKRRALYGEWAGAVGLVYEVVPQVPLLPRKEHGRVLIGADFGSTNATAAVVLVEVDGGWQIQGLYYYDQGHRTVDEHARAIHELAQAHSATTVCVDPAADVLQKVLQRRGVYAPPQSKHARQYGVSGGCSLIDACFRDGSLTVAKGTAKALIDEAGGYEWDERASERGEDKPLKANDHALDALRYAATEVLRRPSLADWYGGEED